jgi:serine/threonine-protein kinase HipA
VKNKLNVILDFVLQRYKVGELFYSGKMGKYAFSYDKEFISSGIEISPKEMPLSKDTYTSARDSDQYDIHGVFADSLPDAWGKLVQDAEFEKIGMREVSTLDRLAFVGKYGIGALRYEPSEEFHRGKEIITLAELRKAMQSIIFGDVENVTHELLRLGGSAGGAHPKFLVDLNSENKTEIRYSTGELEKNMIPVLLKMPGKDDFRQRIEFAYSQMAKIAGINIPETFLILSNKGKAHFAIQRFDIEKDGQRLHTHSYAGIDGFSFRRDDRDYIDFFKMTNALCRNHKDVIEGYRRMLFNYFGGNQDDHGKNFCFTMDQKGKWSLSPAFDTGYSDNGGIHRMSVNGKRSSLRVQDLEHTAKKFEIKNLKEIASKVLESLKEWDGIAKKSGVPENLITKISERIKHNLIRIEKDLR